MKKRQLYDKKTGKNFVPISHTKAVLTPTGETAEARNTRQQQAVQGTGVSASANRYPFMSLGDVTSIADVNRLLDTAYTSTDTKYQGRLRLRRSGQVAWVDQVLMNSLLGNWVQVLYGCYAPSSTGNSVVVDGKYHILWRQRTGTTSMPWRDLTSQMTLKTINGQSIAGSGNIQISDAEQITIDQELDADSENAIANKVVTTAVNNLRSSINFILNKDSNIIPVTIWADSIDEDTYEDGIWWYKPTENKLYRNEDGTWDDHGTVSEGTILVKLSENSFYHKNATGMKEVYGDEMKTLQTKVPRFYHVENTITNNRYTPESGTYEGNGGYVIIDKQTPRPVLVVSENSTLKYYLNWTSTNNGERLLPSEYSFTPLDFYIYHPHIEDSTEIVIGYYDGVWESTDHYDMTGNIAEMYDVAYDENDCDQDSNFPAGDDNHQYAIYNVLLYKWKPGTYEWEWPGTWEQVNRADPDIPFLIKCKNKIWKVWSDEKTVVFDFSPDNALDETSKNAVQNKVVAARINEHSARLNAIETALPSVRGCKVLPIDGVMPTGTVVLLEDGTYEEEGGDLILVPSSSRVVLAVNVDDGEEIATLYYGQWDDAGGRFPYDVYNLTDPTNIIFAWEGEGILHFGKLSGETLVEIAAGSTPTINIDTALNRTSANPVQNAVITSTINNLITTLNNQNERITRMENSATKVVWTIQVWGEDETVYENWAVDDLWWDSAEAELKRCVEAYVPNEPRFVEIEPSTGTLYYLSPEDKWCVWNGEGFDELQREELVISSSTL